MLKRLLIIICLPAFSYATATVSGNVRDLGATNVTAKTKVTATLVNCGSPTYTSGGSIIAVPRSIDFTPDASGNITGTLFRTDTEILCSSGAFQSYIHWSVTYNGSIIWTKDSYVAAASVNPATVAAINAPAPVVLSPTGDTTYQRLDGANLATGNYSPTTSATQSLGVAGSEWNLFAGTIRYTKVAAPSCLANFGFFWYDNTNAFKFCENGGGVKNIGTVTSVAVVTPSELSSSGGPVTTSGTFTFTWTSQGTGNRVFASPNGGAGVPTFRALVGADLPNPAASSLGGIQSKSCSAGQAITDISTSGVVTCTTISTLAVLDKQDVSAGVAGDGTDKVIYTYSMPSGTMAAGKCVQITFYPQRSAGAGNPTFKISFGATAVASYAAAIGAGPISITSTVCNNASSTTAQWAFSTQQETTSGINSTTTTPAENTASGSAIVIKGTFNVSAATSVAGKGWIVELLP